MPSPASELYHHTTRWEMRHVLALSPPAVHGIGSTTLKVFCHQNFSDSDFSWLVGMGMGENSF